MEAQHSKKSPTKPVQLAMGVATISITVGVLIHLATNRQQAKEDLRLDRGHEQQIIEAEPERPVRVPLDMPQMSWKTYWSLMLSSSQQIFFAIILMVLGHLFIAACVSFIVLAEQALV